MIAIIPARGGSKGLPGKNIKILNGKPLIAYTIEAALKSKNVTRVIVSTDSIEIAEISKFFGAEVPFIRPDFLSTDEASSIDVYNYVINRLENSEYININEIIILQPTSPFRNNRHIDEAIDFYRNKNADSVISYVQESHPIFWHKYIDSKGKFENVFEEDYLKNRQALRRTYYPNGAIYIIKKKLLEKKTYYGSDSYPYIMRPEHSVDIDTEVDFEYAKFLLENRRIN